MIVIVLDKSSNRLRGTLTRWLLEVKTGVFVGNVSALVRERLWFLITEETDIGGALMLYNANNEQGYSMLMFGETKRKVIELDGLQLISIDKST